MYQVGDIVEATVALKTIRGTVVKVESGSPIVKWKSGARTMPGASQIRKVGHETICPVCETAENIEYGDDVTCAGCGHVIATAEEMASELN